MNIYVEVIGCPNLSMGYEADIAPRIGETISIARGKKRWLVISVDHLIKEKPLTKNDLRLEIVTVIVDLAPAQKEM